MTSSKEVERLVASSKPNSPSLRTREGSGATRLSSETRVETRLGSVSAAPTPPSDSHKSISMDMVANSTFQKSELYAEPVFVSRKAVRASSFPSNNVSPRLLEMPTGVLAERKESKVSVFKSVDHTFIKGADDLLNKIITDKDFGEMKDDSDKELTKNEPGYRLFMPRKEITVEDGYVTVNIKQDTTKKNPMTSGMVLGEASRRKKKDSWWQWKSRTPKRQLNVDRLIGITVAVLSMAFLAGFGVSFGIYLGVDRASKSSREKISEDWSW